MRLWVVGILGLGVNLRSRFEARTWNFGWGVEVKGMGLQFVGCQYGRECRKGNYDEIHAVKKTNVAKALQSSFPYCVSLELLGCWK